MSIEYKLKNKEQDKVIANLEKCKTKLLKTIDKELDTMRLAMVEVDNFDEKINSLQDKLYSLIEKDLVLSKEDEKSICTIASSKIYWEISLDELEIMFKKDPDKFIIVGDDNSVVKNIAAFKKIIANSEKSFK